ncbi:matrix metalloproteinase-28-like protein [Leptotrombidium deliense]|uniref:Matrix metalloproteinase-28-like protein n=1 Tax=Leptotrombidium deliense TaxID=299467 RepID=A0A443S123_9ACAR|nr:matrix metalloproteinase-28-like protein [Leptotrombidium deliense]
MKTNSKYYALKFNKDDPEKILRHYEMYYLSAGPEEITQIQLKQSFLNIDQLHKVSAVIAALIIPTSGNDYYSGIIYNITEDNKNITEIKFKVNGNVLVAKNSIETNSTDNRMVTLDIFDFIQHQTAIGYRSYGHSFRYFSGTDALPSIIGNTAWFDNQVLIGCPTTHCYSGELDAGTIGSDNKLHIFMGLYHWTLPSDKKVFPATTLATFIDEIPVIGLGPSVSFPIHAAFAYKHKTYLFASNNRLWVSSYNFTDFTEYYTHEVFPDLPESFWSSNVDATFTNDKLKLLFVFKDLSYYVINLEDLTFDDNYLNSFPLGERMYPRPLTDFKVIPEQVDAAITMKNGRTYIFYAEFVYIIEKWNDKTGRVVGLPEPKLIQDVLFDCTSYQYNQTEYKSKVAHDQSVSIDTVEPANVTSMWTVKTVVQVSSLAVGSLAVFLCALVIIACFYERKNQRDRQREYEKKHRSDSKKKQQLNY